MTTDSKNPRGLPIRDIRDDLKQRIVMCEDALTAQQRSFERKQAELQAENKSKVENLKTALANYRRLLTMEEVFQTPANPAVGATTATTATAATATAVVPKVPLADFLYEEIAQKGPRTKDQLRDAADKAGYFPPGDGGGRTIHAILVNLGRAGRAIKRDDETYEAVAVVKQKELL